MLNAPTTTIATWVDVRACSWPANAAVRLNPRKATIELIDRTVDRLRAEASRWSSATSAGVPRPTTQRSGSTRETTASVSTVPRGPSTSV